MELLVHERRSPWPVRGVAVAFLVAGVAAGCGESEGVGPVDDSTVASPAPAVTADAETVDEVEATLDVIDAAVDVRPAAVEEFEGGADGDALRTGDTVRTDAAGFGEIRYEDGSLTRVDVDSSVTLAAVRGEARAPDVAVSLDVGRVWNRVGASTGDRRFEVTTDVGTAAVRGTAFEVDCRAVLAGACLFAVYEGTVEVTPADDEPVTLGPFEYLLVLADGTVGERGTIAGDLTAPGHVEPQWVRRNDDLDQGRGSPAIDGLEDEEALAFGDIYDCGTDDDATRYMRFFADGQVIAVTSTGTPEQVSAWFVPPSEDPDFDDSVGSYTVNDGEITGSTTSQFADTSDITVSFAGTVADDGTLSMTTTSTNGHVSDVTCTPVLEM